MACAERRVCAISDSCGGLCTVISSAEQLRPFEIAIEGKPAGGRDEPADARRGEADRGEHREAAGVIATKDFAIYCVQTLIKG